MFSTGNTEATTVLDALKDGILSVLRERLVGLYLYGSLVSGDFTDAVSDVDLLAATSDDLTDDDLKALERMHAQFVDAYPAWENRVEVAYVSTSALRTFRDRTSPIGIISPGEPLHRIQAGNDWLVNWYLVQESDATLFGPPPSVVIEPISRQEFVAASREHADWWGQQPAHRLRDLPGQSYAILTMCRALYTHVLGKHTSKQKAAAWVQQAMPEWDRAIDQALRWRIGQWEPTDDPVTTLPATARFIGCVHARIVGDNPS